MLGINRDNIGIQTLEFIGRVKFAMRAKEDELKEMAELYVEEDFDHQSQSQSSSQGTSASESSQANRLDKYINDERAKYLSSHAMERKFAEFSSLIDLYCE